MKRPKKTTELLNDATLVSIKTSLISFVAMVVAVYMSFLVEPFEQEIGMGQSILGYNRDFFVNGRWWFVCAAILSLGMAYYLLKIDRITWMNQDSGRHIMNTPHTEQNNEAKKLL